MPPDIDTLREMHSRLAEGSKDIETRLRSQELLTTHILYTLKDYTEIERMTRANSQIIGAIKWAVVSVIGSSLSVIGTVIVYQLLGVTQ